MDHVIVETRRGHLASPDRGGSRLDRIVRHDDPDIESCQCQTSKGKFGSPTGGLLASEICGRSNTQNEQVEQMWAEDIGREIVEEVGVEIIEGTELASSQGLGAKGEVDLASSLGGEFVSEEGIGVSQQSILPKPCEPVEDHIDRGMNS